MAEQLLGALFTSLRVRVYPLQVRRPPHEEHGSLFIHRLPVRIAVEAIVKGRLIDGRKGSDVGLILGAAHVRHGKGDHEWEGKQA